MGSVRGTAFGPVLPGAAAAAGGRRAQAARSSRGPPQAGAGWLRRLSLPSALRLCFWAAAPFAGSLSFRPRSRAPSACARTPAVVPVLSIATRIGDSASVQGATRNDRGPGGVRDSCLLLSSGGRRPEIRVPAQCAFWRGPPSWFWGAVFLRCPPVAEGELALFACY